MPVEVNPEENEARCQRELRKSGNSIVVSLPPQLLEQAGFELGDEVLVAAGFEGGEISIRQEKAPNGKPGDEQPAD
ncbi:hypothetical protein GWK26_12810 [haloarchaeon 3A1-DGR]|nr:hypothetical protein GWK26_12810 [haloarchaeon 3A1-DGR]